METRNWELHTDGRVDQELTTRRWYVSHGSSKKLLITDDSLLNVFKKIRHYA